MGILEVLRVVPRKLCEHYVVRFEGKEPQLSAGSVPASSRLTDSICYMNDEKLEFLKGTLDMLILKVVALGPIHGYAIAQRIQQIGRDFFQLQQGSLYPALHRLEDRGWLKAQWKTTETGRDAKFYGLTPRGRTQLETEVENWGKLTDAVALILRTAE